MGFSQENKSKLYTSNNCYMVGMLAENEEFYPNMGDEQASITTLRNSSNLIFYIKPLSSDPQPITELIDPNLSNPLYIGIDSDQNNILNPMSYKFIQDFNEKKKFLHEKLKGKLILYRPKITINKDEKVYKNAIVVAIETDIKVDKSMEFIPVPTVDMKNAELESKLKEGSNIILDDYNHAMYSPEYIICNDYLYLNLPELTKQPNNQKLWTCEKYSEKIERIKIDINSNESDGKIVSGVGNILFIDKQLLFKLESQSQREKIIEVHKEIVETSSKENLKMNNKEYNFIKAFNDYTMSNNLCYSFEDLINLHICIKTNPLTILAGMSGTGKSELANYYAKMLKASEEYQTLLFLPISPSYTEPGDILGFLNNTTGLYIPSETGLTDFFIHAKNNPDSMHIVIFDEMNLSQVEYWFAPFISLLERNPDERRLYFYSPKTHCINEQSYPNSIIIKDNVRFIGTINVDETTKDFSDRLLDRANIINLKKVELKRLNESISNLGEQNQSYKDYQCDSFTEYQTWISDKKWIDAYSEEEIEFIDELHELLNKFDSQKGVSFRITRKIGEYLLNIPLDSEGTYILSKSVAFDIQIKQRLITKIKGTEKQYGRLIGMIKDNSSEEPLNSELYNFFNSEKAAKISDFKLTKQEIIRKAKELGVYGYAN